MRSYLLKRLLLIFPTLLGIVTASFAIIQLVPGGPVEQALNARLTDSRSELTGSSENRGTAMRHHFLEKSQIEALKKIYGFDQPWYVRYVRWCKKLFTFQFGESYFFHKPVSTLVWERLPVSISLGMISFLVTYLICIPLGVAKGVRAGSKFDLITSLLVLVGHSLPGFVLGIFLIVLFAGGTFWDFFPLRGLVSDNFSELTFTGKILDYLHHITLPAICLSVTSLAVMTSLTRNVVLDHIRQQYVLTARSKGLKETRVIWKHVFRNAMIPLVTGFAGNFLSLFFGAAILIETLFSLEGLGYLSYNAVMQRDYPIVMASIFFFSLLHLLANIMSDVLYVFIDPRISFETHK